MSENVADYKDYPNQSKSRLDQISISVNNKKSNVNHGEWKMYKVKGYVGSEEKLKQYFVENVFEGKTRVLFVADEILPDNITCFEYLDSIRQSRSYKESDDTLEGLLEFAGLDKNSNASMLSVGERSRLLLTSMIFLRAEDYVLCGLYEGVTTKDAEILDQILTELSLSGNLHIGYIGEPPTDICDEIIYL